MAAKKLAKPVTETRDRGPTVTRQTPPLASRGTGLRETRHQETIRIRAAVKPSGLGRRRGTANRNSQRGRWETMGQSGGRPMLSWIGGF